MTVAVVNVGVLVSFSTQTHSKWDQKQTKVFYCPRQIMTAKAAANVTYSLKSTTPSLSLSSILKKLSTSFCFSTWSKTKRNFKENQGIQSFYCIWATFFLLTVKLGNSFLRSFTSSPLDKDFASPSSPAYLSKVFLRSMTASINEDMVSETRKHYCVVVFCLFFVLFVFFPFICGNALIHI